MSMPWPSALTPFALEIMIGRLPCAGGVTARVLAASAGVAPSNRLAMPAAALPASEVRKNFRRDHKLIVPPNGCASIYNNPGWKAEDRNSKLEKPGLRE